MTDDEIADDETAGDETADDETGGADFLFADLPTSLAVFPLPGAVLLPGGQLPLNIFEPRYLDMVRDAMAGSKIIGMVQPAESAITAAELSGGQIDPALHQVGCGGAITSFKETEDGRFLITLTGVARFVIEHELAATTRYRQVVADWRRFENDLDFEAGERLDRAALEAGMRAYLKVKGIEVDWKAVEDASANALVTFLTMAGPFAANEKQALLETVDVEARGELLLALMEMAIRGATSGSDGGQIH